MSKCELIQPPGSSWTLLKELVLNSVSSKSTKRAYSLALDQFQHWYSSQPRGPFSKAVVQEYRAELERRGHAGSTICSRLAPVRRLAVEAADNGLLDPFVATAICRVHGPRRLGRRIGNWLTEAEASELIKAPDTTTLKGKRDQALLAVMIGCGLRRNEVVALTMADLQMREERWIFADLKGKHGRIRTVPIPEAVKKKIDCWTEVAGITSGVIFRAVNKADAIVSQRISAQAVYEVTKTYACRRGLRASPHDLRRTFAKSTHANGAPIEQIQYSLGHASIITTELYLGLAQDLKNAPGDRIRLDL